MNESSAATIHHEVDFDASIENVYEALLDERQFAAFTRAPAQIDREAGGEFNLIGGTITGRNVELLPNRRVVQAWRLSSWPPGVYSIVRFELVEKGSGARVVVDHSGIHSADEAALSEGWSRLYWEPLRRFLIVCPCCRI